MSLCVLISDLDDGQIAVLSISKGWTVYPAHLPPVSDTPMLFQTRGEALRYWMALPEGFHLGTPGGRVRILNVETAGVP